MYDPTSEGLLPSPTRKPVDLLIVAAEHSGDEHAARMVRGLLARQPNLVIAAVGGPRLAAAGAQLLRDLTGESAIGFAVFAKISYYQSLMNAVVCWIGVNRPRAVCFVDSSGLNLRIAYRLHLNNFSAKGGGRTKAFYYISPQIWASRARRRFEMEKYLDGLAAIFPFEPKIYADTKLPVEFVGHPFVAPDYVPPVSYDPAGPILLLPGSRKGAVARIFPVILEGYRAWGAQRPAVVLYPSDEIRAVLQAANPPASVIFRRTGEGPVAASAVLTSSGTMSMHCALAGIPGVVTYKTDFLTYWIGRMLVTVEHLGIANLLLKESMYPEYIQGAAKPAALARELKDCLENPARIERTREQAVRLRGLLAQPAQGSVVDWMERQLR